jgi:hypothetical protein
VVDQIRCIGRDPTLISQIARSATELVERRVVTLKAERHELWGSLRRHREELRRSTDSGGPEHLLADIHERMRAAENRVADIDRELTAANIDRIDESEVSTGSTSRRSPRP